MLQVICETLHYPSVLVAVEDEAVGRVVGGDADRDAIPGDDPDPEPAHRAAELRRERVAVFELDDEMAAAPGLGHGSFEIRQVVLRQDFPHFPFSHNLPHLDRERPGDRRDSDNPGAGVGYNDPPAPE